MTILLVQTFLLLLGAFLLGASLACLVRRGFAGRQPEPAIPAASPGFTATPATQPAVHAGDADRFGRALTGGHGAATASFQPVTGPVVEVQPRPPVRVSPLIEPVDVAPASEPEPAPAPIPAPEPQPEPQPQPERQAAPSPEPAPQPQRTEQSYTQIAVAAAAGAAALAASRGLAASEVRDDGERHDAERDASLRDVASASSHEDGRSYTEIATGIVVGGGVAAAAAAGHAQLERAPEEIAEDEVQREETAAEERVADAEPDDRAEGDPAGNDPVASRFGTAIADAIVPLAETGDDLTRIHSIDADLRGRLNRLGVTRFSEIGAWSASDLVHFSQSLGVVPGRIEQENWVGQAQVLASGGVTDYSRWRGPELMPRAALPADGERLHRIIGIDPDSEAILRANGVTRLLDVAAWTEDDVSWYERILGAPGRIGRENWVEQARFLTRGSGVADAMESVSAPVAAAAAAAAAAVAGPSADAMGEPSVPEAADSDTVESETVEPEADGPDADRDSQDPPQALLGPRSEAVAGLRSVRSEALIGSGGGFGTPVSGDVDDLKRIRGIGVLIEKKLHSLGVISYEQVANWSGEDIDRISQLLDFKGRIERENWIEQARILASGGQTEFSRRVDRGEA